MLPPQDTLFTFVRAVWRDSHERRRLALEQVDALVAGLWVCRMFKLAVVVVVVAACSKPADKSKAGGSAAVRRP